MIRMSGFCSLKKREQPMIVPVVPMLLTKCVIDPAVSRQISGAVPSVVRQADCPDCRTGRGSDPSPRAHASRARSSREASMPPALRRQHDARAIHGHGLSALHARGSSGMTRTMRYPRIAATIASAMPVLPLVASIRVSPGLISPRCFGAEDHRQRRTILDGPGRVVPLQLGRG
jgi:hypothetical protein